MNVMQKQRSEEKSVDEERLFNSGQLLVCW
jgi:hypothetical protein